LALAARPYFPLKQRPYQVAYQYKHGSKYENPGVIEEPGEGMERRRWVRGGIWQIHEATRVQPERRWELGVLAPDELEFITPPRRRT
jgi:hypothetical protein